MRDSNSLSTKDHTTQQTTGLQILIRCAIMGQSLLTGMKMPAHLPCGLLSPMSGVNSDMHSNKDCSSNSRPSTFSKVFNRNISSRNCSHCLIGSSSSSSRTRASGRPYMKNSSANTIIYSSPCRNRHWLCRPCQHRAPHGLSMACPHLKFSSNKCRWCCMHSKCHSHSITVSYPCMRWPVLYFSLGKL